MADLTPVEQAILEQLTADYAAEDAARYVTEARVLPELERRGTTCTLGEVWRAVAAYLDANPGILAAGPVGEQERDERNAARVAAAERLFHQAANCHDNQQYDDAMALLERAELASPLHTPTWHPYQHYRDAITKAKAAAAASAE